MLITRAPPFRLSSAGDPAHKPSPLPGQHTDDVLQELGYTGSEIESLRAGGII